MTETLSWARARRIALRAQGMGPARRTARPSSRRGSLQALAGTLQRTHLLQIDSVSVFARAHHLPVFTRTGSWDPAVLDTASRPGEQRLVREALAHEAAYATHEVHDLLAFRRARARHRDWEAVRRAARESPQLLDEIRDVVREQGPLSAAAVSRHLGDTDRGEGWGWRRTSSQWAVEYLFRSGELDCVGRSSQFERLYMLVEGAPRAEDLPAPPTDGSADPAALRALVSLAARAHGIAQPSSLADYFRLGQTEVRPAIEELRRSGELREVHVELPEGPRPFLLHRDAPEPAPLRSAALVSPFDPIVFHRPRLQTLYDVEYRIGIYTPAAQRSSGYYSLPFLQGDRFPARVDLKADRARGVLEVRGAYREELGRMRPRERPTVESIVPALAGELSRAARWQGLETVEVLTGAGTGELSAALAAVVRSGSEVPQPA
ncbi:winged helix-turn-helix domain-containing protein [Brachybacterium hainanense]|uniref:Winged helix-turn-helix domain-containing protein n=1 Tax=Brachybacterium hainanense TaxID=1541174 RepID=A0ABV6RBY6_9MICO